MHTDACTERESTGARALTHVFLARDRGPRSSRAQNIFPARSEAEIFARLGLVYEEPWERFVEVTPLAKAPGMLAALK